MSERLAALWLVVVAGALGWLLDWLADAPADTHPVTVSTVCPHCNQTVQPVITLDADAAEDGDDWLDMDAGVHCPHCHSRFGDVDPDDLPGRNQR